MRFSEKKYRRSIAVVVLLSFVWVATAVQTIRTGLFRPETGLSYQFWALAPLLVVVTIVTIVYSYRLGAIAGVRSLIREIFRQALVATSHDESHLATITSRDGGIIHIQAVIAEGSRIFRMRFSDTEGQSITLILTPQSLEPQSKVSVTVTRRFLQKLLFSILGHNQTYEEIGRMVKEYTDSKSAQLELLNDDNAELLEEDHSEVKRRRKVG